MPRNSSGTMSLPAGNPVVSGTTISSTVQNNTTSDIATEITDSLSRTGKGAMLAPLELDNGTVSLPALTFDSDPDSGIYRIGANDIGIAANGVKTAGFTTTGLVTPIGITATHSGSSGTAITATGGASNGTAILGTGDGTGKGGDFQGGDSSGAGVRGTGGAPNGSGVQGIAATSGTGYGVLGTAADNASSAAIYGLGIGVGVGGEFVGDTSYALKVGAGNVKLSGANPSSSTGFTNVLLPANLPKCFGTFNTGAGVPSIANGFNLANVTCDATDTTITIADDMASGAYTVIVSMEATTGNYIPVTHTKVAGSFKIRFLEYDDGTDTWLTVIPTAVAVQANFVVFGAQ
jgi:hypothetical protein